MSSLMSLGVDIVEILDNGIKKKHNLVLGTYTVPIRKSMQHLSMEKYCRVVFLPSIIIVVGINFAHTTKQVDCMFSSPSSSGRIIIGFRCTNASSYVPNYLYLQILELKTRLKGTLVCK